jgi:hypothetical protein
VVPQHEIFQTPFKVDIQYDTVPTPDAYRSRGLKPGDPLKVWHVQNKGFQDGDGIDAGLVSTGDGFTDSPDAEYISGGVNHKTPTAVAIGRHGPFFLWGFSAAPKDLTESGRRAFLNSIVYTAKFDRAPLLVRNTLSSRDRATWIIGHVAALPEEHANYNKVARQRNRELAAAREKAKTAPDTLTAKEKQLLELREMPEKTYDEYVRTTSISRIFPADVVQRCGLDAAKLTAWYEEHRPYLYSTRPNSYEVDEDAKALGIPNYDPRLLDACVAALDRGPDAERATRLLQRYTGETFATPAEWRAWLAASRADLFFSDIGGYRFFSKVGPAAAHRRAVTAAAADEPTDDRPVVLSAVVRPATATVGDTVTVAVRMRIVPGWHTYAAPGKGVPAEVTRIEDALPAGAKAAGAWQLPAALPHADGAAHYTGDVVFLREVTLEATPAGEVEIPVTVSFQACDRERCLPPESVKLTARLEVRARARPGRGAR